MDEPSILDYLKSKLSFRNLLKKPETERLNEVSEPVVVEKNPSTPGHFIRNFPLRSLLAVLLAIGAQRLFEPQIQNVRWGLFLYFAAGCMLVYALIKNEWNIGRPVVAAELPMSMAVRKGPLFLFIPLLLLAFLAFSGNKFSALNIVLWIATLGTGLAAFWIPERKANFLDLFSRIKIFISDPLMKIRLDPWKLLILVVFLVAAFFHLYHLRTIPLEMTSDHTEKLLDVNNVLNGQTSIFFPNNGGREPIHFYVSAFLIKVFNTGFTFFTLKLGMALAFLLSLFYMYKLGKEVGTKWTGLFLMLFIGFAAWPNILTRVGLRLILTPAFVAPVLFYFLRGLRTANRNDFVLAGIFTGLGLMGYSAFRIMPLVLVAGLLIYLIHQKFQKPSRSTIWTFCLLMIFMIVLSLPLIRFAVENPNLIGLRTLSRLTSAERPLPAQVAAIFFQNFWNAATMPFWKDGSTWVIAIPGRPALDVVMAALYFLGILLMLYRWIRSHSWQDLFLLISIPILMLPSILSLAFPEENPSLSRAGGAVVPILLICAIAFESLFTSLFKRAQKGFSKGLVVFAGIMLIFVSASQNYDLALKQYPQEYANATWNTSQMGEVVKDFVGSFGKVENVWVIGVAHWVDTRLVAINAGYVGRDFAVWPQDLETTLPNEGAKLFIVKVDDLAGMARLQTLYPTGFSTYYSNIVPGRDFIAYLVPPAQKLQ